MFFAGGVLALREARKERSEEELVEREVASHQRVAVTAFVVIFLAEWGDLTQILTANLAAHYHDPLSVGVGALLALWAVAALAVVAGQSVLRLVNIATVRIVTAVVLFALDRVGRLGGGALSRVRLAQPRGPRPSPASRLGQVPERLGQLTPVGQAELLVGPVEPVLDRAHGEVHQLGDLLVRAAGRRLERGVELGRGELGPDPDGADERA